MTKYNWKDEKTRILRMLRNSRTLKQKNKWSREAGAGFIAEDIQNIWLFDDEHKTLGFRFPWRCQYFKTGDLNLRETEEVIKFLEKT